MITIKHFCHNPLHCSICFFWNWYLWLEGEGCVQGPLQTTYRQESCALGHSLYWSINQSFLQHIIYIHLIHESFEQLVFGFKNLLKMEHVDKIRLSLVDIQVLIHTNWAFWEEYSSPLHPWQVYSPFFVMFNDLVWAFCFFSKNCTFSGPLSISVKFFIQRSSKLS